MKFVAAKCPQCGANLEVDPTKEAGICSVCGTPFITEKAIIKNTVNNNYSIQNAVINMGDGLRKKVHKADKTYKLEATLTKQDFFRKVILTMSQLLDVPDDIFKAEFKSIESFNQVVLKVNAKLSVGISCNVGYQKGQIIVVDDNEQVLGTIDGDIDWRPYNQTIVGQNTAYVINNSQPYDTYISNKKYARVDAPYQAIIGGLITNFKAVDSVTELSPSAVTKAECIIRDKIYSSNSLTIGDYIDGLSLNHDVIDYHSVDAIIVPCYKVNYTYKDKEYSAWGFAVGEPNCQYIGYPPVPLKKRNLRGSMISLIAAAPGVLLTLIGIFFAGNESVFGGLFGTGFPLIAIGSVIGGIIRVELKKTRKKNLTKVMIPKYKLKPVTKEELAEDIVLRQGETIIDKSYRDKKPKKKKK